MTDKTYNSLISVVSRRLLQLPGFVVVPQRPGHLVKVHGGVILLDAPQIGQAGRVDDLEHAPLPVRPGDKVDEPVVVQEMAQEIPLGVNSIE